MTRNTLEGRWKQLAGKVKQRWADLTDDDLAHAEGSLDRLAGRIEEKYGEAKHDIRRKLEEMQDDL